MTETRSGARQVVVIRADASIQIGSGHVMRCLTLADTLREWGAMEQRYAGLAPADPTNETAKALYALRMILLAVPGFQGTSGKDDR